MKRNSYKYITLSNLSTTNCKPSGTVCILNGIEIDNLNKLYSIISSKLNFPDYFGRNLDALDECLNDLEWIDDTDIYIMIYNFSKLLFNENYKKKREVLDILNKSVKYWMCENNDIEYKRFWVTIIYNDCELPYISNFLEKK